MKKVVAMVLSLVMALGLMAGCGQKDSGSGSGAKTVESLKIAFSPYADADQITTATEPLEALLKAKLLEKGYDVQNIDMTVGTSYTAVGEALSAGSADIGFISGGNYVLFPMIATCCSRRCATASTRTLRTPPTGTTARSRRTRRI